MADGLQLTFGDAVDHAAYVLASLSGVDLRKARPATVRLWEARGLALHHLAEGDMDEALKVMAAVRADGRTHRNPDPNQPPTAAKETP